MCHAWTALPVTVPSLPPARAYGTSCRSAYATLGYHWLLSTNIQKHTHSPSRFEIICNIYDLFAPFINLVTFYLLTYLPLATIHNVIDDDRRTQHCSTSAAVILSTKTNCRKLWRSCTRAACLPSKAEEDDDDDRPNVCTNIHCVQKKTPTHIFFHISMNYLWS